MLGEISSPDLTKFFEVRIDQFKLLPSKQLIYIAFHSQPEPPWQRLEFHSSNLLRASRSSPWQQQPQKREAEHYGALRYLE